MNLVSMLITTPKITVDIDVDVVVVAVVVCLQRRLMRLCVFTVQHEIVAIDSTVSTPIRDRARSTRDLCFDLLSLPKRYKTECE